MSTAIENLTQHIGREIFARVRRRGDGDASWLDRQLMQWTMRDERVKAELFRFVDVLPTLRSAGQVNRHFLEYMRQVEDHLPAPARAAMELMPSDGFAATLVASVARAGTRRLARRFIAASNPAEALDAVVRLRQRKTAFTIDLLGEAVLSEAEAKTYYDSYVELLSHLCDGMQALPVIELIDTDHHGSLPRVNVSVKLSSLFSQFDPIDPAGTSKSVRDRLRPILRLARRRGAFVNVDMEQYAFKDLTLRIFREILEEDEFKTWRDAGIAIQAYLRDCLVDLRDLAAWVEQRGTPVWVRMVKGAYWDYESVIAAQNDWSLPVFDHKAETDANFETATQFLLEHHELLRPAIGSHNVRSIARALALAEQMQLPPRSIEFQMLYGMADPIKSALVSMGQRVRVYTPVGQLLPGMSYLVRRLLENTSNESFLRAGFFEHVPEEQLLMNPTRMTKDEGGRMKDEEERAASSFSLHSSSFRNEPISDFSRDDARAAMQAALEAVRGQLGRYYPLVIDGRRINTSRTIESFDPSHRRRLVGRCAGATVDDAQQAVAVARRAFEMWRDTPATRRAELLRRAAQVMRRRRFELAAWEVYECAKPWREADADVAEAIDYCDYYAHEMLRLSQPQRRDVPGEDNAYFYDARGVAVIIAPWNFPLAILCGMTTAALAAGNTAIMKPAEQSPVIAAKLMEIFEEAGFPSGVVNYLPGVGEEIGPTLVSHPQVDLIAFTGSRAVGLEIQRLAGQTPPGQDHVKRVITEMGGKNAIIVDEDADLDEAVHGVAASAFGYAGQKCSACSRAIVLESVYEPVLRRLIEATRSLRVGVAEDPATFVSAVIDDEARQRILKYIDTGRREATLAFAGDVSALADEGTYVAPHIFTDVSPDATIAQEEIFGPVLAVIRARDLDDAIRIANGTKYALTGGIYSRSPANIDRARREFRVGNLYINRKITGALVDRQPFGGFKLSGIGSKAGGPDYLPQFLIPRTVTENTLRRGFAPQSVNDQI